MTAHQPLRVGIVGCGGIAHQHAKSIASSTAAVLAACCDVVPEAAERYGDAHGCERAYTDYVGMIREHDLDAVLFATWPNQHHEQVLRALDAGARNILCEKALTLTGEQALDLWRATRDAGAFLMEGFMYRHHPVTRRIEEVLATGDLGPVDHVRAAFSNLVARIQTGEGELNWRLRPDRGGGVPWDLACYCVNACNHFNPSTPVRVFAATSVSDHYGTIDRLYGVIEYEDGSASFIESSHRSVFDQELAVLCAQGKVRLGVSWTIGTEPDLTVERPEVWGALKRERIAVPAEDPYRLQIENFASVVRRDAQPVVRLSQSVANAYTLGALVDSGARGSAVDIELPAEIREELACV